MGKRGNNAAAKAAAKKPKVDPALAAVMDTVKKADHLPDHCRAMLANMLPFSLTIVSDERAEFQKRVVSMAEEVLSTMKSDMQTATTDEEAKLETLKGSMAQLLEAVKEAEAAATVKKEACDAANAALADATATANTSKEALSERQTARKTSEAALGAVQQEKAALEDAFQNSFRTPMDADQGPHIKELEPFLKTMDIDKSMRETLPGTCAKSKEDRGSFDTVILDQLEKAINAKISSLGDSVTSENATVAERTAAEAEAEADFNAKTEVQNKAKEAFEAAQKEKSEGDEAVVKANEAVNEYGPKLEEATRFCDSVKTKLTDFESGPFANFVAFQTKTGAAEVAPAGA